MTGKNWVTASKQNNQGSVFVCDGNNVGCRAFKVRKRSSRDLTAGFHCVLEANLGFECVTPQMNDRPIAMRRMPRRRLRCTE